MKHHQTSLFTSLRRKVRLGIDRAFDRNLGIDTVIDGQLPLATEAGRFQDSHVNGPVSYLLLYWYLQRNTFTANDVFYDIGCGDGRGICFVARRQINRCVGIELSSRFAEKARRNATSLRSRKCPIDIRQGDAADMDYRDGTVFYFGDPFGSKTLRAVLSNIGDSLKENPRVVRCIFVLRSDERSHEEETIQRTRWLSFVKNQSLLFSPMYATHWQGPR